MGQIGYRGLYSKKATAPFRVSRSKIELFTQCQRCFWLEAVKGIKRPDSPPFNINKAIDELFKKEFDSYRTSKKPHPIMKEHKVEAIPYSHEELDHWRDTFSGVFTHHEPTNLLVFGAVDDVWVNSKNELIVVDYKATAKNREVSIDADWQTSYKRQIEVYQWLLRQNGFDVSDTGYFVYANGNMDAEKFENMLQFTTKLISYTGNSDWVEPTLQSMKQCLDESKIPEVGVAAMGGACNFCMYAKARTELTLDFIKTAQQK